MLFDASNGTTTGLYARLTTPMQDTSKGKGQYCLEYFYNAYGDISAFFNNCFLLIKVIFTFNLKYQS